MEVQLPAGERIVMNQEPDEDSILLCASDLQHAAIFDNYTELRSCVNAVAKRLAALSHPKSNLADSDVIAAPVDHVNAAVEMVAGAHPDKGTSALPFPVRIMDQLQEIARREDSEHHGPWTDGDGEPLQDDADAAIAWIKAATPVVPAPVALAWLPIETAPQDGTLIDIWRPSWGGERCTDMQRFDLGGGNVFYSPKTSGPSCVRDATHWMPLPPAPGATPPQAAPVAQLSEPPVQPTTLNKS